MRPQRRMRCRKAAALGVVVGAALLAGCGVGGGLRSTGPAPNAVGPARLWPELPPASAAPYDYGEGETARIPGIEVPHDDVHRLDPVAVVRAGLKARPNRGGAAADLPADTVRRIDACRTEPASCPVLRPYFRDLTGDGKDELVLGIRLADHQLSIRVYMPEGRSDPDPVDRGRRDQRRAGRAGPDHAGAVGHRRIRVPHRLDLGRPAARDAAHPGRDPADSTEPGCAAAPHRHLPGRKPVRRRVRGAPMRRHRTGRQGADQGGPGQRSADQGGPGQRLGERRRPRMPPWTATLTGKSAVFITVMCCALAALLSVLVHTEVTRATVSQAREEALSRLADVGAAYKAGEELPPGSGIDPPGLPTSLRALAAHGRRGTLVADHNGRPAMWAAAPADGRALATQVDYSQSARTINDLDGAIIGSSLLATGATVLVGAFAVTRVTRRLHQTARVARRISAGDLDARVDDPRTADPSRPQDEVAIVAGALDTMASTLQRKLLTEQRFTADVAHELRTPLTGLSAAAELLPPGRPSELVRDRVRTMRALTEDLLEISRLDARTEQVELDVHELAPLVERVVRASGTDTEIRFGDTGQGRPRAPVRVETDKRRLERVLGNLITNAHKHGRPRWC